MRVLFASSELAPLAASGGLGEAVSGLARALSARGHALVCAVPAYRRLRRHPACPPLAPGERVALALPGGQIAGRWLRGALPFARLAALEMPLLYDGESLYGEAADPWRDAALRFIAFSRAVAELARVERPDVLVAHDWQAALALCALRAGGAAPSERAPATVQVVHNNAFQGLLPAEAMALTGLPAGLFGPEGLEFYGELCLLKAGLLWADRIVAVSPTYARELETPEQGLRLEGVYRARSDRLTGIANGIDTETFDPERDPALAAGFSARAPEGKDRCRKAALDELGLGAAQPGRFFIAIGRLTLQKGWDVLADALADLVALDLTLALLGDGDPALARRLRDAAARFPGRVHFELGWDERLARRLYAGADCALVPSRFEPCGLVQRMAQRYGTLPVAHRTGGLADTIDDGETGILFDSLDARQLVAASERAARWVAAHGDEVRRRLLTLDVSWRAPAARWEALLEDARRDAQGRP
jgi:starch synthase